MNKTELNIIYKLNRHQLINERLKISNLHCENYSSLFLSEPSADFFGGIISEYARYLLYSISN